jgi:hypothetical protein
MSNVTFTDFYFSLSLKIREMVSVRNTKAGQNNTFAFVAPDISSAAGSHRDSSPNQKRDHDTTDKKRKENENYTKS